MLAKVVPKSNTSFFISNHLAVGALNLEAIQHYAYRYPIGIQIGVIKYW